MISFVRGIAVETGLLEEIARVYVAPLAVDESETESTVLAACRELVARDFTGGVLALDDRFPGDSLHQLEAVIAVEEALAIEIPDEDVMAWTTPRELAVIVERAMAANARRGQPRAEV